LKSILVPQWFSHIFAPWHLIHILPKETLSSVIDVGGWERYEGLFGIEEQRWLGETACGTDRQSGSRRRTTRSSQLEGIGE
jgi:hypothetical protein